MTLTDKYGSFGLVLRKGEWFCEPCMAVLPVSLQKEYGLKCHITCDEHDRHVLEQRHKYALAGGFESRVEQRKSEKRVLDTKQLASKRHKKTDDDRAKDRA